ncbi:MAG: N-acetylneuraminate synthase [Muribaculaceae bacterium]|nr:N-acetylneuraminate synthase [Muribaculaceae bacterium]
MRTLVIAEAGVNHNGSFDLAVEMIHAAKRVGADIIKFQTFEATDIVTADAPKAQYQKANDDATSQLQMLRRLELTRQNFVDLKRECECAGIEFMSTPFSIKAAKFLAEIGMRRWKIASGEITNLPLLEFVASVADNVILSTGMSTEGEIETALEVLLKGGLSLDRITLLHCTTAYPTPLNNVNLRAMDALRKFGVAHIGYSDHTKGTLIAVAAVAAGATVVEKHFTLDVNMPGPDHKASITPEEFVEMVAHIRDVELALGDGLKRPNDSEIDNISVARKSIVAAAGIKAGDIFSAENLTIKRPGTGISPMMWHRLLGRVSKSDYKRDQLIDNKELI